MRSTFRDGREPLCGRMAPGYSDSCNCVSTRKREARVMLSGRSMLDEPRTLEKAFADLQAKYQRKPSPDLERTIELLRAEIDLREWKRPVNLDTDPANTSDQRVDARGLLPERTARSSLAHRHTWFARGYSTSSPRGDFESRPAPRQNLVPLHRDYDSLAMSG